MPAYNYYSPYGYQPQQIPMDQYQQVYKPPSSQNPINNYGLIWAKGEEAAKAYPTAPSTTLIIWDADNDVFYKKTTDAQGKPILFEVYEYVKRQDKEIQNEIPTETRVPTQSNDELTGEVKALTCKIDELISALSRNSQLKETSELKADRIPKRSKEVFVNAQSNV